MVSVVACLYLLLVGCLSYQLWVFILVGCLPYQLFVDFYYTVFLISCGLIFVRLSSLSVVGYLLLDCPSYLLWVDFC